MSISLTNISKSYGKVKALTNISLDVKQGGLFGLIGPDGAGKTTLFRILTTRCFPMKAWQRLQVTILSGILRISGAMSAICRDGFHSIKT